MSNRLYIFKQHAHMHRHGLVCAVLLTASCMRAGEQPPGSDSTATAGASPTVVDSSSISPARDSASPAAPQSPATPPTGATQATTGAPAATRLDTLRGVVQRVGNDPVSVLVLTVSGNGKRETHALRGDARALLERVSGLEVVVRGSATSELDMMAAPRGARVFQVKEFAVRAADGVAAVDGVLSEQGGKYQITTGDGVRHEIASLPSQLRSQMGARVFLIGSLKEIPTAYGVITPR